MSRRFIVIVTLFVVSGLAGLECGRMLAQSTASSTLVLLAPGDIKWESGTRPDIVRAPLWGDRAKGPYGMFNRYDGGVHLAAHFHTNELRGLIMSGTWILQIEGSAARNFQQDPIFPFLARLGTRTRAGREPRVSCT